MIPESPILEQVLEKGIGVSGCRIGKQAVIAVYTQPGLPG